MAKKRGGAVGEALDRESSLVARPLASNSALEPKFLQL